MVAPDYEQGQEVLKNIKYKDGSSFRHRDNGQGLIKDFTRDDIKRRKNPEQVSFNLYEIFHNSIL